MAAFIGTWIAAGLTLMILSFLYKDNPFFRFAESVFAGVSGKIAAFEQSIKEAVRGYARKRVFNKPREINGEVLLWEEPRVTIDSGDYVSTVRIKLFIRELIPYSVF